MTKLTEYLGDTVQQTSERNECFNTEQGPFDNGKLWCQVATVMFLKEDTDYKAAGTLFIASEHDNIESHGANEAPSSILERYTLLLKNGVTCNLVMQTSENKRFGSTTSVRFISDSEVVLAVACSDRAKAKHYPFVEQ